MSDTNELEDFAPLKTVPTFDVDSDGCMERNDEGWGDWVRDDDARGLLRRIDELEAVVESVDLDEEWTKGTAQDGASDEWRCRWCGNLKMFNHESDCVWKRKAALYAKEGQ